MPPAYERSSTLIGRTYDYCMFILDYQTHFERRFVQECELWKASYDRAVSEQKAFEERANEIRMKKAKALQTMVQNQAEEVLDDTVQNHVLRRS